MIARLTLLWDRLRNSLWALPIAMVIASGVIAILALRFRLEPRGDAVWWLYSGDSGAAAGLLGSLLSGTITMATLAISITMVVLTLAAQSLGPRLIPIFMGDTRTKLTLGVFIGTVAYLLIVLRTVAGEAETVPQLAITLGSALVLASVVLLLFFVHHLARSIVADTIIARVGTTLDEYAASLLPERTDRATDAYPDLRETAANGRSIEAVNGGYIQFIDHGSLVSAAEDAEAAIVLAFRSGHFVLPGDTLAWVKPPSADTDAMRAALISAVAIGAERTAVQDIEYSVRQLVEIAVRALSPGINDPNTACTVIDRLAQSLAIMMRRGALPAIFRDGAGTIRLLAPTATFEGILDAAFNEIRQAGAALPAILIRLAHRLGLLLAHANPDQAKVLVRHIDLVQATARRGIPDTADLQALEASVAAARAKDSRDR